MSRVGDAARGAAVGSAPNRRATLFGVPASHPALAADADLADYQIATSEMLVNSAMTSDDT